jgi:hypothetical protein
LQPHIDIEAVAVGLCVDQEREPVAAAHHLRLHIHQRPARPNVGLAQEARDPRLARDRLLEPELCDAEAADADVEAGQDRLRLVARPELGKAVKDDEIGL